MMQVDAVDRVARLLAQAQRVLFITGAGVSADSGLPTYRGIGGLYHERLTAEGLTIEEALSGEMMARRPDISWKYIAEIEGNCRGARPNAAHRLIAAFEREKDLVCVLTQNVDGLHAEAGSRQLIEIHGNIRRLRCNDCMQARQVPDYAGLQIPPECPRCGGTLRPDIVLFGEALPAGAVARLEHVLESGLDLVVSIGTSSIFPYIAGPVMWAARQGLPTVEVNPGDSAVSRFVEYHLRMSASDALHELWYRTHPREPAED